MNERKYPLNQSLNMKGGPKKSDKIKCFFGHHCEAVDVTETMV